MIPVRDISVSTGLYNTISGQVSCCIKQDFYEKFYKSLAFELIEGGRIEGVSEASILYIVLPLVHLPY